MMITDDDFSTAAMIARACVMRCATYHTTAALLMTALRSAISGRTGEQIADRRTLRCRWCEQMIDDGRLITRLFTYRNICYIYIYLYIVFSFFLFFFLCMIYIYIYIYISLLPWRIGNIMRSECLLLYYIAMHIACMPIPRNARHTYRHGPRPPTAMPVYKI